MAISGLVVGAVLAVLAAGVLGHGVGVGSPRYSTTMSGYASTGMMGTPGSGGTTGHSTCGGMWGNGYPSGMLGGAIQSNPRGRCGITPGTAP